MIRRTIKKSLISSFIAVFIIDLIGHFLLSTPAETYSYFLAKFIFYFIFTLIFLAKIDKIRIKNSIIGGLIIASIWGIYYNVLPVIFNYIPLGIPLSEISFLGMGILGSGIAFGLLHIIGFVGGMSAVKRFVR